MRKSKQRKPIGDNMDNTNRRPIGKPIGFYTAWNDFTLVCRKQLHSNQQDTPMRMRINNGVPWKLIRNSSPPTIRAAQNRALAGTGRPIKEVV